MAKSTNHHCTPTGAGPGSFTVEWSVTRIKKNGQPGRMGWQQRVVSYAQAQAFCKRHGITFYPEGKKIRKAEVTIPAS